MNIRRRKKIVWAESCATSDLAFLLIIYFIVIAGFNLNKGFLLNLPAKDSTRLVKKDDVLRYRMDAAGGLLFDGAPLSADAARADIARAVAARPNLALMLTIDPKAPWQRVVSFVETAENLSVDSFSFKMDGGDGAAEK